MGMTRLIPGEKLDDATRRNLRDLIRAVAGDTSPIGSQLAGERIKVLAPRGEVTVELIAFVDRVLALAVPHCPRCLDVSIGLCNPCRPEHAAELADAIRGITLGDPTPVVPAPAPTHGRTEVQRDIDPAQSCFRKHQYPSEIDAKRVARRIWDERGVNLRAYQCEVCGGFWHLTKQVTRAS
jgi:hypothetical protein